MAHNTVRRRTVPVLYGNLLLSTDERTVLFWECGAPADTQD